MQSHKDLFRFIAHRYGLGYVENRNEQGIECYLTSAYLPNYTKIEDSALPKIISPQAPFEENPLYTSRLLNLSKSYFSCGKEKGKLLDHLFCASPTKELSEIKFKEILTKMDALFVQVETKERGFEEKKMIFDSCQIGIKSPIHDNQVLWSSNLGLEAAKSYFDGINYLQNNRFFSKDYESTHSTYSMILNFSSFSHLQRFIHNTKIEGEQTSSSVPYIIYTCNFGLGCHQILIPFGQEKQALETLFKKNNYLKDLPCTDYLCGLFKSSIRRPNDQEVNAVLEILKYVMNNGNVSLTDLEAPVQTTILNNFPLQKAFETTVKLVQESYKIRELVDSHLPPSLSDIVMSYRTLSPPTHRK